MPPDRSLSITDALNYLDAIKAEFHNQPAVYNHFVDIMKEFKHGTIDTPGVIKHVSHLFSARISLVKGFSTFLPVGYRLECSEDPHDSKYITITTPTGTTMWTINNGPGEGPVIWSTTEVGTSNRPPSVEPEQHEGQSIEPAV